MASARNCRLYRCGGRTRFFKGMGMTVHAHPIILVFDKSKSKSYHHKSLSIARSSSVLGMRALGSLLGLPGLTLGLSSGPKSGGGVR